LEHRGTSVTEDCSADVRGAALRVVAVVQARLSSRRLPGKVLRPLGGRPLLAHLLEVLATVPGLDGVVVATSADSDDDPVAAFAAAAGVAVHRGPLDDVAGRLLGAAAAAEADALVRVNGDSPLLDPALVRHAVRLFREEVPDLVTNVLRRTYPRGQSVEVIRLAALRTAIARMTTAEEREHVTPYFYRCSREFTIRSFEAACPAPEIQLSVDEPEDLVRCEAILAALGNPSGRPGWEACVRAAASLDGTAAMKEG
jgi:spore coat polysaccharide biosynthesis protein SpsF